MLKKLLKFGGDSNIGKVPTIIVSAIGLVIIILIWHFVTATELVPSKILPNPFDVLASFKTLISDYNMFGNAWYSIKLNLISYIYAILIALPLGFLIALYPINNIIFGKYINSIRYLPIPAMSGIFIAIFGLTFGMKSAFLAFSLLIYILPEVANRVNALQNPSNDKDYVYLQTIKTLGANNWQKFKYVYFPYVTRTVSESIITLTGISWSYVCICEALYKDGTASGIGAMTTTMMRQSHTAEAYALLFVIVIIGILQDFLLKGLDKILFPSKYNRKSLFK